jgi:hypothetical protein
MAKVKGCGFSGRAVRNAFTAPADRFNGATPFRRVGCVHPVPPVKPSPVRPHAEGCCSTVGSSSKGEMHSAKTFCVPQNFRLRPFPSALRRCSFALCRERTHQEMDNHHHRRNQDAHTKRQRQNRRSRIFQEDGEEQNPVSVAREWVAQATSLKGGHRRCVPIRRRSGGDPHQRNA